MKYEREDTTFRCSACGGRIVVETINWEGHVPSGAALGNMDFFCEKCGISYDRRFMEDKYADVVIARQNKEKK